MKIWRRERILVRIRHLRDGLRQAKVRALAPHWADPPKAWGDVLTSNIYRKSTGELVLGKYVAKELACLVASAEQDSERVYVSACVS